MVMKKEIHLTKTDFIHHLQCPKSLWLLKHKPEIYPHKERSDYLKRIGQEGDEVEQYAQRLFRGGVLMPSSGDVAIEKTKEAIDNKIKVLFQATAQTEKGHFARADILERSNDNSYLLYEVKSSSSIKEDHIKDICFQKIVFEQFGLTIDKLYIIHTIKDYVGKKVINPSQLLTKVDVTAQVREIYEETAIEVNSALSLLQEKEINESGCDCLRKTRSNHCDAFEYFNGDYPIWELDNISEKKLHALLDRGVQKIGDIREDIIEEVILSKKQHRQVQSVIQKKPIIDVETIADMLNKLEFPLYFLDYETASSAIPKIVGTKPWQHIPFQFSLHIMNTDGYVEHEEFVSKTLSGTKDVISKLCAAVGDKGSVVSWHAQFEKARNVEMSIFYPEYRQKLENINNRMFDLEEIFEEAYTDARFRGSTSIKKVLPILCPDLSYKDLEIQDGTQAMNGWFKMIDSGTNKETRAKLKKDLLKYCKLDTWAMVKLYESIKKIIS